MKVGMRMEGSEQVMMGGVDTGQKIQARHTFETGKKASGTLRAIETKRSLTPPLYLNHEKNKEENPLT